MNRYLLKAVVALLMAIHALAWNGDVQDLDGPIGEYVRTLKESVHRGDTSVLAREEMRLLKGAGGEGKKGKGPPMPPPMPKTPAPTVTMTSSPSCPPTRFVATKKGGKKSKKAGVKCFTPAPTATPTAFPTCAPTTPPVPTPTMAPVTAVAPPPGKKGNPQGKKRARTLQVKSAAKQVKFSCKGKKAKRY